MNNNIQDKLKNDIQKLAKDFNIDLNKKKDIKENGLENIMQQVLLNNCNNIPLSDINTINKNANYQLLTYDFITLTYKYTNNGLYKTLIQQPIIDAFKNFTIITDQLDEEEKDKLLKVFNEKNLKNIIMELFFMNRLYGGAVLYFDKNDYIVLNRWDITNTTKGTLKEEYYNSNQQQDYYFLGEKLDKNRMIILTGEKPPYYLKKILNGWGLSILEVLVEPTNLYEKTLRLIYELLDESKIDIYKVDKLTDSAFTGQDKEIAKKISLMNKNKSFQNAIVMDKEDDFEQKQLTNLSAIVDILKEIKLDICNVMKIPAIILWGMSPSGFSSGEFDLRQYQDKIKQEIQPQLKQVIVEILKREAIKLFDLDITDLDIDFENFIIQTKEEQENTNDKIFSRLKSLYDSQLLTKKEFFEALKENNIYKLQAKASEVDEYSQEQQENIDKLELAND